MSRSELLPKLRFPEFENEWRTISLGDIVSIVDERVGSDICVPYSVTSGQGLVRQNDKFGRSIAGRSIVNYIRLRKDDFAYNKSATKAFPEGYIARFHGDDLAAVPKSIFTCFRLKTDDVVPAFLDHQFSANIHGRFLRSRLSVGARAHGSLNVSDDDILAIPVPVPVPSGEIQREEQTKIAECLTSLDDLIVAEGRKLEALRRHKKGLLQQLFPQPERVENGVTYPDETTPRLRFPGFRAAGDWEELEVGALFGERVEKGHSDKQVLAATQDQGVIPYIQMNKSVIRDEKNLPKYKLVKPGDFVISLRSFEGGFEYSAYEGIISPAYVILSRNRPIDDSFFKVLFKSANFIRIVQAALNPNLRDGKSLSYNLARGLVIRVPHFEEQSAIGGLLAGLDNLITVQAKKLDILKTHKRGLMQGLFPSLEYVNQ